MEILGFGGIKRNKVQVPITYNMSSPLGGGLGGTALFIPFRM